jgi:hypothetical protein
MSDESVGGPVDRDVGRMPDDERAWREGWAFAYSGAAHLYGDDGELQDNRWPPIDWMRDSAIEIRDKIRERGMRQLAMMTPNAELSGAGSGAATEPGSSPASDLSE